jgi:hypothetical protein
MVFEIIIFYSTYIGLQIRISSFLIFLPKIICILRVHGEYAKRVNLGKYLVKSRHFAILISHAKNYVDQKGWDEVILIKQLNSKIFCHFLMKLCAEQQPPKSTVPAMSQEPPLL